VNSQIVRVLSFFLLITTLVGCAGINEKPTEGSAQTPMIERSLRVEDILKDSAKQIAHSVRVLHEVKNAELTLNADPDKLAAQYRNSTVLVKRLDKPISLEWHGEAYEALKLINKLTDFGVVKEPVGNAPLSGAIVKINANSVPAQDIIQNIGAQLGDTADVRIIPPPSSQGNGLIEIEYKE